ncbi:hypothetical protein MMC22_011747 [Lobaria immixta]|nr:hypothetical protein [Lobaria immixta]
MWLIDAHTLKLEEVWDENVKEYAILSHRWEDGEVSFQQMQNPGVASSLTNFAKIQNSCEHAVSDGYNYVWVDTCCINKESSAELSEAINSMYRWYKASAVCYVFLSDVHANALNEIVEQQIKSSVWFNRGWTLQELLAPEHVVFYNQQWEFLGTKQTLSKLLTLRTDIDDDILNGEDREDLSRRSIAQRMSWASKRVTTRPEDTAYCLLGIFDVNMPMLYGEREKAFLRLQEEIIKRSDDHSIFSWPIHRNSQPGLLADSPAAFENCQHIETMTSRKGRSPYSLTNRGLSIKLMATQFSTDTYIVRLDCFDGLLSADDGSTNEFHLGMFLRRLDEDDQYARVKQDGKTFVQLRASAWDHEVTNPLGFARSRPAKQIEINVQQRITVLNTNSYKDRINGFRIATPELLERSSSGKDRYRVSAPNWSPQDRIMSMKLGTFGTVGFLDISQQDRKIKVIKLGFDFEYNPVCFIAASGAKSYLLDRNGQFNLGLNSQVAHWTEEKQAQLPGIHQQIPLNTTPFDTMAWSEVWNGVAIELEQPSGLWALKGDRVKGLNIQIIDVATVRIERGEFQDKVVWDVFLDNVKNSIIRKFFKENDLAVHNRDEVNEAREAEDQDREARLEDQRFEDRQSKPVDALSTPSLTPKSTYDLGRTFAEMGAVGRVAMARQEIAREQAIKEHRALIPFALKADSQLPQIEERV